VRGHFVAQEPRSAAGTFRSGACYGKNSRRSDFPDWRLRKGERAVTRAILAAALALSIGLATAGTDAGAQVPQPRDAPPAGGEAPEAASPSGARYIPGVGFRFAAPLPRVYGYYGASPPVYGYYADRESMRYRWHYRAYRYRASCDSRRSWRGERCGRRWH
jgi:hypothetical protein